jgi:hypothetical protein
VIGRFLLLQLLLEWRAIAASATRTAAIHTSPAEAAAIVGLLPVLHDHDAVAMRAGESVGLAPAVRRCDDRVASWISQKITR